MNKLSSFVFGCVVGAGLMFGALNYHVVKTNEKVHLIPKQKASLRETYVDVRDFSPQQWTEHPELAAAIMTAGKPEIMQGSAMQSIHGAVDSAVRAVGLPVDNGGQR